MSIIRNISQEAKLVNEMFPDVDYSVIVELLKECRSVDDVIEQILSGNESVKWKKSKNAQKKAAQSQQIDTNSHLATGNSNSIFPTAKISNQSQSNKSNVNNASKHVSQGSNGNSKNNNVSNNFNKNNNISDANKTKLHASEISIQVRENTQVSTQSYDLIDDSFTSVINQTGLASFNNNIVHQAPSNQFFQKQLIYQNPDYSFGSVLNFNAQKIQQQKDEIGKQNNYPTLTLPKDLQHIRPNMSRFGSFAGPVNSNTSVSSLVLSHSNSNSTSNQNLYSNPPFSYNSTSPKTSLSPEENRLESFQSVIVKDATTQFNNLENPNLAATKIIGHNINNINDLNSNNETETIHQVNYQNIQYPGHSQYQMPYSPIYVQQYPQQIHPQQFQQQQIIQQQQQQQLIQMQNSGFQPSNQAQPQQIISHQYMSSNPKIMIAQQQIASPINFTMPYQKSQENIAGNK